MRARIRPIAVAVLLGTVTLVTAACGVLVAAADVLAAQDEVTL